MRTTDWFLLVFLSVLWGGSFFFVAIAARDIRPFTLVLASRRERGEDIPIESGKPQVREVTVSTVA